MRSLPMPTPCRLDVTGADLDDAYLGGVRSGGKRGRGAAGKTPFVAAVSTSPEGRRRKVKLAPVKGFRKVRAEAELGDVRLHDLRHSHASLALRQGETVLAMGITKKG